jgi:hypothetical protein
MRCINAGKARKAGRPVPIVKKQRRKKSGIKPGDVFGYLTAIELRLSVNALGVPDGYTRWFVECRCHSATNDARFISRISVIRRSLRLIGWASCAKCYWAAGGWNAIKELGLTAPPEVLELLGGDVTTPRDVPKVPKPEEIAEPVTVERIVMFVKQRPACVKVTTLGEIQKVLGLTRKFAQLGVQRAVARGLIMKKRVQHASGYVYIQQEMTLMNEKPAAVTPLPEARPKCEKHPRQGMRSKTPPSP